MADVVGLFREYGYVNVELLIGNMQKCVLEVMIKYGRCCLCVQEILRCKCEFVNWKFWNSGIWKVIIIYDWCGEFGQGILWCKCVIVNWKYVTGFWEIKIIYGRCDVCGQGIQRSKCVIVIW